MRRYSDYCNANTCSLALFFGFILGLLSDPYYGIKDVQDARRAKRARQIKNWIKKIRKNSDSLGSFGLDCGCRTSVLVRSSAAISNVITFLTFVQEAEGEEDDRIHE